MGTHNHTPTRAEFVTGPDAPQLQRELLARLPRHSHTSGMAEHPFSATLANGFAAVAAIRGRESGGSSLHPGDDDRYGGNSLRNSLLLERNSITVSGPQQEHLPGAPPSSSADNDAPHSPTARVLLKSQSTGGGPGAGGSGPAEGALPTGLQYASSFSHFGFGASPGSPRWVGAGSGARGERGGFAASMLPVQHTPLHGSQK